MAGVISRRSILAAPFLAASLRGQSNPPPKLNAFPSDISKYPDPTTEFDVYRLTSQEYSSILPAHYNRAVSRNGAFLLFYSDRTGSPQAFRLEVKTGQFRQLTDVKGLDGQTLCLTSDNRAFCYFAGRSLMMSGFSSAREREIYRIPDGWERCAGLNIAPGGAFAVFGERQGENARLRLAPLTPGAAITVTETAFPLSHPICRPLRTQILYRQENEALWLVNFDGKQNRKLKTAGGSVGTAGWSENGKTLLYLDMPHDRTQLNAIHELTPDANTDKLLAKTSQYGSFGWNRDTSVFAGASANKASPTVLLLLRVTRREFTLCEHKASDATAVNPTFSPDSQRLYFQSDRSGKPALYSMHIERLVEKTEDSN